MYDLGYRVEGCGLRVWASIGTGAPLLLFRGWSLEVGVLGFGFAVQGFIVQGLGFRVWGLELGG